MTETPGVASGAYYKLTNEEWLLVWDELRPAELKILYYLRTLDPFGDRNLEIGVRELGRRLGMSHSTVSRGLKVLDAKGYIDMDLISVNVKVRSLGISSAEPLGNGVVSGGTTGASRHHSRSSDTTCDREAPPSLNEAGAETPDPEASQPFSTEGDFVPEQTLKNTVKQNSGATPTPAPEPLNGKGNSEILALIPNQAGVPLNAALVSVIQKVCKKHPHEAQERVSNAISAYLEQRDTVMNPQAFISAALQRGFTSNQAKRQKRPQTEKQEGATLPPEKQTRKNLPPPPPLHDLSQAIADISIHCDRLGIKQQEALQRFGLNKLPQDLTPLEVVNLADAIARW